MKWFAVTFFTIGLLVAPSAKAHHGVASVGFADPEGPGVGMETTAALTLPAKLGFAMAKTEFVSFQAKDRLLIPEQKQSFSFNMAALGFGITPSLSGYVFQPFAVKTDDQGSNAGFGDTNVMLAFGWKWDEGLRLIPKKESLDELRDWHFLLWASSTIPVGPTERKDSEGNSYPPDVQTGFGAPGLGAGFSVLKQFSTDFTVLAEINYLYFLAHDYSFGRYKFGAETRASAALACRLYGRRQLRVDVVPEVSGVNLQRDQASDGPDSSALSPLSASGGTMLYGGVGVRAYIGRVSVGAAIKRALLRTLNEESEQQGSEGLENFRVSFAVSVTAQL